MASKNPFQPGTNDHEWHAARTKEIARHVRSGNTAMAKRLTRELNQDVANKQRNASRNAARREGRADERKQTRMERAAGPRGGAAGKAETASRKAEQTGRASHQRARTQGLSRPEERTLIMAKRPKYANPLDNPNLANVHAISTSRPKPAVSSKLRREGQQQGRATKAAHGASDRAAGADQASREALAASSRANELTKRARASGSQADHDAAMEAHKNAARSHEFAGMRQESAGDNIQSVKHGHEAVHHDELVQQHNRDAHKASMAGRIQASAPSVQEARRASHQAQRERGDARRASIATDREEGGPVRRAREASRHANTMDEDWDAGHSETKVAAAHEAAARAHREAGNQEHAQFHARRAQELRSGNPSSDFMRSAPAGMPGPNLDQSPQQRKAAYGAPSATAARSASNPNLSAYHEARQAAMDMSDQTEHGKRSATGMHQKAATAHKRAAQAAEAAGLHAEAAHHMAASAAHRSRLHHASLAHLKGPTPGPTQHAPSAAAQSTHRPSASQPKAQPHALQRGKKGGAYYLDEKGHKVYPGRKGK